MWGDFSIFKYIVRCLDSIRGKPFLSSNIFPSCSCILHLLSPPLSLVLFQVYIFAFIVHLNLHPDFLPLRFLPPYPHPFPLPLHPFSSIPSALLPLLVHSLIYFFYYTLRDSWGCWGLGLGDWMIDGCRGSSSPASIWKLVKIARSLFVASTARLAPEAPPAAVAHTPRCISFFTDSLWLCSRRQCLCPKQQQSQPTGKSLNATAKGTKCCNNNVNASHVARWPLLGRQAAAASSLQIPTLHSTISMCKHTL